MSAALADVVTLTSLPTDHWRPATRGECPTERPCPYVGCRYHLYLEVRPGSGALVLTWPDREPDEIPETCALDVGERGGASLKDVARAFDLTRQRVQQIEIKALAKAKKQLRRLGLRAEQLIPDMEPWREEDESPRRRPSPTEEAGLRWFGDGDGDSDEYGGLFWEQQVRSRAGEVVGEVAGEEEGAMQEQDQTPTEAMSSTTTATTEAETPPTCEFFGCLRPVSPSAGVGRQWNSFCDAHAGPNPGRRSRAARRAWEAAQAAQQPASTPVALCPCGCGQTVRPGKTYASKGCAGRVRWRGVGRPKERAAESEPAATPKVAAAETSTATLAEELRDARREAAEEHERYEKQLRHSASLDETIKRRNGRIAELEQQLGETLHLAEERLIARNDLQATLDAEWAGRDELRKRYGALDSETFGMFVERLARQQLTVREETALRYEQETASLTTRLEALEAENARLLGSLHEERRQREQIVEVLDLGPGAPLDAILRRVEILRWHAGEAPDDAQSPDGSPRLVATWPDVCERVGLITVDRPMPTWTEYCSRAAHLLAIERGEHDGEPLDLVALPRPEDLPAAWLFRYVRYGLEQTEAMTDLVDRISGGAG